MDCQGATFSDASVFAREGRKDFDTKGTEGGFEGVADGFGITMEGSDFVTIGVVDGLDSFIHGCEERGGGFGECARLGDMASVLINHGYFVSESSRRFAGKFLGVEGDIFTRVGSRGGEGYRSGKGGFVGTTFKALWARSM